MSLLLDVEVLSVFEAAFLEARHHRWIESQKAGRDLGDAAFLDWYRRHWWRFLRHRHVEHLLGDVCWQEFNPDSFGVLGSLPGEDEWLAAEIVELYREGGENLGIIQHAYEQDWPLHEVRECLLLINMNDARLDPRFN